MGNAPPFPRVIMPFGGITLDEKYKDYMTLAIMFSVLTLMMVLLFFNKTGMVEKGTGAIGQVAGVLSGVRRGVR